MQRYWKLTLEN